MHPADAAHCHSEDCPDLPGDCVRSRASRPYFAYSTARVSRITVTLIWPG
jgi:hypothetical protein